MQIAILANNADSFVKHLAEGLHRMLSTLGVSSDILYSGLTCLQANPYPLKSRAGIKACLREQLFLQALKKYQVVVVVSEIPGTFMSSSFQNIGIIRHRYPDKIIVNYGLHYLLSHRGWYDWLKKGNPKRGILNGGNYGLERFDWYLLVSDAGQLPLDGGVEHPYSRIGINLDDGSLYPSTKSDFIALIDFEQPSEMKERMLQVQALEKTDTPYIVLNGHYPISEIREIYRQCSIYFVAWWESFGLPICELQACGAYVFTPDPYWVLAHAIRPKPSSNEHNELSANFIVYRSDPDFLKQYIQRIKQSYSAAQVFKTYTDRQPHLYYGDIAMLSKFIKMINRSEICSTSHRNYEHLAPVLRV